MSLNNSQNELTLPFLVSAGNLRAALETGLPKHLWGHLSGEETIDVLEPITGEDGKLIKVKIYKKGGEQI